MKMNQWHILAMCFFLCMACNDRQEIPEPGKEKQDIFGITFTTKSTLFGIGGNTRIELTQPGIPLGIPTDDITEELVKKGFVLISSEGDQIDFSVKIYDNGNKALLTPSSRLQGDLIYKVRTRLQASSLKSMSIDQGSSLPDAKWLKSDSTVQDTIIDWENMEWKADTLFKVANWEPVYFPELEEAIIMGIDFLNDSVGFAVGSQGVCLKTTNQGQSWQKVELGTYNALYNIKFLDDKTGYIIGENTTVFRTTDGGNEWWTVTGLWSDYGSFFLRDVSIRNENEVAIVGEGNVWFSADGGNTWNIHGATLNTTTQTRSVAFVDENLFLTGSDFGIISSHKRYDEKEFLNGSEIRLVEGFYNTFMFEAFDFLDENTGFTVGANAYKRHSEMNWSCCSDLDGDGQNNDTTYFWAAISAGYFIDFRSGEQLADTAQFRIYKTNDGSQSWDLKANGEGVLKKIDFPTQDVGYATGFEKKKNGTIHQLFYKSTDGGESWKRKEYMGEGFLYGTKFINDKIGFMVGFDINPSDSLWRSYPVIFKTYNGGGD